MNDTTGQAQPRLMFGRILHTQWIWGRTGLLPMVVVVFTLPLLAIQPFNDADAVGFQLQFMLRQSAIWSPAYPIAATVLGLLLGTTAWSMDHRGGHVYALTLPLPRWQFTAFRLLAGAAMLLVVGLIFWIGAVLAVTTASVPLALKAYPNALAGRFLLASIVAYTAFFAIASSTPRVAGMLLGAAALVAAAQFVPRLVGAEVDVIGPLLDLASSVAGPLGVFTGRWMLIDF